MVDVVDRKTRSRMMAGIRGKDTKPELELRRAMHALGCRYRLHDKRLPGKPDLVLPRFRAAIFVHGCFWHRHEGCRFATVPATRTDFWTEKFQRNIARDREVEAALHSAGWRIAVVWECAIKSKGGLDVAKELEQWLEGNLPMLAIPS